MGLREGIMTIGGGWEGMRGLWRPCWRVWRVVVVWMLVLCFESKHASELEAWERCEGKGSSVAREREGGWKLMGGREASGEIWVGLW